MKSNDVWRLRLKQLLLQRVPDLERALIAGVAELADAPDLGSGISRCVGSSPIARTGRQVARKPPVLYIVRRSFL